MPQYSHREPEVARGAIAQFPVPGPGDAARVDLLLRVDAAARELHECQGARGQFDVRVADVIGCPGPAVDHDRQITRERPGEMEHDARAIRQPDPLADDVAE